MLKFSLALLLAVLSLACCTHVAGAGVVGSGTSASETRTLSAFTEIHASGAFQLEVQSGAATASVVIQGDDNIVPVFVTQVSGDALELHLPNGSYSTNVPLIVRVSAPTVVRVKSSGAIGTRIDGVSGAKFDADLSGSCKLRAAGAVDAFAVDGSGATQIEAFELVAQNVSLDLSGSSKVDVNAALALDVTASGASTVRYRGKPEVKTSVSGAATVRAE